MAIPPIATRDHPPYAAQLVGDVPDARYASWFGMRTRLRRRTRILYQTRKGLLQSNGVAKCEVEVLERHQMLDRDKRPASQITEAIDRIASVSSWVSESAERASRFAEGVQGSIAKMSSCFDKLVLNDRLTVYLRQLDESKSKLQAGIKRHEEARLLVSAMLPKRGWYLSGHEPCTLSLSLASSVQAQNWEQVDREVMEHLPEFQLDELKEWLTQIGVPDYCVSRLFLFLTHHREERYEEATYLGVPLMDELARHLYEGKAFTTKRGNTKRGEPARPELAIKTASGPDLEDYCRAFVDASGSLQEDSDHAKLGDEDYWNRHAIVHGMMHRAMGIKDSAKCLMAIRFLVSARKENASHATG